MPAIKYKEFCHTYFNMGDYMRSTDSMTMNTPGTTIEYVWLGGKGELHSKTRILQIYKDNVNISDIPEWNYDGSSTGQASGFFSEIILKPARVFKDPYRTKPEYPNDGLLVLCSTYNPDGTFHVTNHRHTANLLFNSNLNLKPWFGMEQEYFIWNNTTPPDTNDPDSGHFYCSVGTDNAVNRCVAEKHLKLCLKAGVKISGINSEVEKSQWEYQIGPCEGIEAGDHLWIARYLMECVAEDYGVYINMDPKPITGDRNGSGCHVNYSTAPMREQGGMADILQAIKKLGDKHFEHMTVYGKDNEKRLTGNCETANYDTFTYGVGNRGASIRIGSDTHRNGRGYFEDRRPGANIDPYLVTSKIFETTTGSNWANILSNSSDSDEDKE